MLLGLISHAFAAIAANQLISSSSPRMITPIAPSWFVAEGVDAVQNCAGGDFSKASNVTCVFIGKAESAAACEALIVQRNSSTHFSVWTWHDSNQGVFANDCIARVDNIWYVNSDFLAFMSCMLFSGSPTPKTARGTYPVVF